jgi:hypothetical protein
VTDSERFYNSILDIFEDPEEKQEVDDLAVWWNRWLVNLYSALLILMFSRQIFPSYSTAQRPLIKNSALARIREKRARMNEILVRDGGSGDT